MKQVIIIGISLIFIMLAMQTAVAVHGLNDGSIQLVVNQLQGGK